MVRLIQSAFREIFFSVLDEIVISYELLVIESLFEQLWQKQVRLLAEIVLVHKIVQLFHYVYLFRMVVIIPRYLLVKS